MAIAESDPDAQPRVTALEQRLQELGWTNGRNIRIDYRWPAPITAGLGADFDRMFFHAKDLAQAKPDAILATGTPMVAALKNETGTVPIVFVQRRSGRQRNGPRLGTSRRQHHRLHEL
jgi:hypothetical protein